MALGGHDPHAAMPASRLAAAGPVIFGGAVVFAAFALLGWLALPQALLAWALLSLLALWRPKNRGVGAAAVAVREAPAAGGLDLLPRLLDGVDDPVLVLDHAERVVAVNEPARALFPGLRPNEPFFGALRNPDLVEAIRRAVATGERQRAEFSEHVPVDRWYAAMAVPVATGARPPLVVVTFHDLTPLRRVEEMRADFVANASHELRTPLATLSGFVDTLRGPARDDPAAREKFLDIMHAQATRMARLIDDLLSLSRIELNAHVRPQDCVDLAPVLRQVADGLQMLARERDAAVNLDAAGPLVVMGDRDELLRVFENLVENAIKYAASGKRVDVTAGTAPGPSGEPEAVVAVRDCGPGIAPEHLPRLTERFYRVDPTDSRAQGGTGLGLALVKHILNRHGGRLTIQSAPGEGSTFTVHLPLPAADEKS